MRTTQNETKNFRQLLSKEESAEDLTMMMVMGEEVQSPQYPKDPYTGNSQFASTIPPQRLQDDLAYGQKQKMLKTSFPRVVTHRPTNSASYGVASSSGIYSDATMTMLKRITRNASSSRESSGRRKQTESEQSRKRSE